MIEKCGICQEETINVSADFVTLPCAGRHAFHPECIKPWLSGGEERNGNCPFCRAPLRHTCGHILAAKHLQAGKVINSSVLAKPCGPGCHPGVQNDRDAARQYGPALVQRLMAVSQREARAEQERIRLAQEQRDEQLRDLRLTLIRMVSLANRQGLSADYPLLISSLKELHDLHRRQLLGLRDPAERMPNLREVYNLQCRELLNRPPPAERMPNPLGPLTLGSVLGASVSNPIVLGDDDDNIE